MSCKRFKTTRYSFSNACQRILAKQRKRNCEKSFLIRPGEAKIAAPVAAHFSFRVIETWLISKVLKESLSPITLTFSSAWHSADALQLVNVILIYSKINSFTSPLKSEAFNYRPLITPRIRIRNEHKQKSAAGWQRRERSRTSNESLFSFDVDVYFHAMAPSDSISFNRQHENRQHESCIADISKVHLISSQIDYELSRKDFLSRGKSLHDSLWSRRDLFIFSGFTFVFRAQPVFAVWGDAKVSGCRSRKIKIKMSKGFTVIMRRELTALKIYSQSRLRFRFDERLIGV